jgi:hypothetical protein
MYVGFCFRDVLEVRHGIKIRKGAVRSYAEHPMDINQSITQLVLL